MTSPEENSNVFKWQYCLVENSQARMRFILPRKILFSIALLVLSLGLIFLLNPQWFEKQPLWMVSLAGWLCMFLGLSLFCFVLTRSGEVIIDSVCRIVIVSYKSPKEHTALHMPFRDFQAIETRQVKDMHGLHNRWNIELVGPNDIRIKVGANFNGTFRKKVRDNLVNKMSEMIGISIKHLE